MRIRSTDQVPNAICTYRLVLNRPVLGDRNLVRALSRGSELRGSKDSEYPRTNPWNPCQRRHSGSLEQLPPSAGRCTQRGKPPAFLSWEAPSLPHAPSPSLVWGSQHLHPWETSAAGPGPGTTSWAHLARPHSKCQCPPR